VFHRVPDVNDAAGEVISRRVCARSSACSSFPRRAHIAMKLLFISIPAYQMPLQSRHARWHLVRRLGQDAVTAKVCPIEYQAGKKSLCRGLWTLASQAHHSGHEIRWRDGESLDSQSLRADFRWADQLWLYAMTPTIDQCLNIAKEARKCNPNVEILLGGPHGSAMYKEILMYHPEIDVVCLGWQPAEEFMRYIEHPVSLPGCAIRVQNKIRINGFSKKSDVYTERVNPAILQSSLEEYYANVSTSVGCAFSCSFCVDGSSQLYGRNLDDLCEELALYESSFPEAAPVHFFDTIFTLPKKRCLQICDLISQNTESTYFTCDIKAGTADRESLEALHRARFRFVAIGFETSIEGTLREVDKRQTFRQAVETARLVRKYMPSSAIKAYWLFGLPGTTKQTLQEDICAIEHLLKENIVDIVSPKLFVPYPGTVYHDSPEKFGLRIRTKNFAEYDRFRLPPVCYPNSVGPDILADALIRAEETVALSYAHRLGLSIEELSESAACPRRYNGSLYATQSISRNGLGLDAGVSTVRIWES